MTPKNISTRNIVFFYRYKLYLLHDVGEFGDENPKNLFEHYVLKRHQCRLHHVKASLVGERKNCRCLKVEQKSLYKYA